MGYYTSYMLSLVEGSMEDYDVFLKEIAEESGESELADEGVYAKWYNYKEDMLKVCSIHPELIVQLDGVGEDGDNWSMRFKGEESEEIYAVMPPFKNILSKNEIDKLSKSQNNG